MHFLYLLILHVGLLITVLLKPPLGGWGVLLLATFYAHLSGFKTLERYIVINMKRLSKSLSINELHGVTLSSSRSAKQWSSVLILCNPWLKESLN